MNIYLERKPFFSDLAAFLAKPRKQFPTNQVNLSPNCDQAETLKTQASNLLKMSNSATFAPPTPAPDHKPTIPPYSSFSKSLHAT